MTEERIVRRILMSAVLGLGVVGCPPVPPDDSDAGVGGSATGGSASGGGAAGGKASVAVCATVESLPTMGTSCATLEESQCDATGNRCICERGIWYCTTSCASTYPTEPIPDSACMAGAACNYSSGVSCQCFNSRWACIGTSDCPAMPMTGDACHGLAGRWCDYPNSNPAWHFMCACYGGLADASTAAAWSCFQSPVCPTTQPPYDLNAPCAGFAICSYGSVYCNCKGVSGPWVCGLGVPPTSYGIVSE